MDPCKDFFSCLNRRFSVHKYTLCAHSSVQSVTPCDWYGLQQVEQGNRSRSVEQNNWSRGSGIYATQISKVLDWINLGLFHRIECARCPPRHTVSSFSSTGRDPGALWDHSVGYDTWRERQIHMKSMFLTPKHLHSVLAWFELCLDWRSKVSRSKYLIKKAD